MSSLLNGTHKNRAPFVLAWRRSIPRLRSRTAVAIPKVDPFVRGSSPCPYVQPATRDRDAATASMMYSQAFALRFLVVAIYL